jgi:hypothetical protein
MKGFAPRTLISAQGVLAAGDPHLRDGYHFRIHTCPWLGLPIAPLSVYRMGYHYPIGLRKDVTWVDSRNQVLEPPFAVRPDNPVFGYLPGDGVCGWFELDASIWSDGWLPLAARRRTVAARRGRDESTTLAHSGGLMIAAQVISARGWATVTARDKAPWIVTATPIERVVLSGSGQVDGARWVDLLAFDTVNDVPITQMVLPVEEGRRYRGVASASGYAAARTQATRAAPLRRGLHEVPWVSGPAAALGWLNGSEAAEGERLDAVAADLVVDVQSIVDGSLRACEERSLAPIVQGSTTLEGEGMSRPLLGGVQAAMQDAGIARLMGQMSWDDDPPLAPLGGGGSSTLVYHVIGFWQVEERDGEYGVVQPLSLADQAQLLRTDVFWPLPADAPVFVKPGPLKQAMSVYRLRPPREKLGPVAMLRTAVVVRLGDPMPSAPAAPEVSTIAPAASPWAPGIAPAARRRIQIAVQGLVPGAGVALARRSGALPLWLPLNPAHQQHRALIVPAAPKTAASPGTGELGDRDAPADDVSYRLAQCDGFGRWSAWRSASVAASPRALPPRPVVEANFLPAALPDSPTDAALRGSIRVSVAQPPATDLPPGAYLLDRLKLLADGAPVATLRAGSGDALVTLIDAPALPVASRQTVGVSAFWVDTQGQSSALSNVLTVNCWDPRVPAQAVMPPGLQYAARADAAGHCGAAISWPVLPGQWGYRVFVADESVLMTHLRALEAAGTAELAGVAADLRGLPAPERAERIKQLGALFPRRLFRLLNETPIAASGDTDGTVRFEHPLSAALAGLSFFRVVVVAETNVEAPFEAAALVPIAVPNSPLPATPTLEVRGLEVPLRGQPVPGIRVTLGVPPGRRAALEYRLFASSAESRDVDRMPLWASGPVERSPAGRPQRRVILLVGDTNPGRPDPALVGAYDEVHSADIRLWMRYQLRADVRGKPEPGSGNAGTRLVVGEWSAAAPPVALLVLPSAPPEAPSDLSFDVVKRVLSWLHPQPLRGRHAGSYAFDIYRTLPDEREALLATVFGDAPPNQGGRNADGSGSFHLQDRQARTGTRYRVILSDPLGRPSPFAELTLDAAALAAAPR